MTYQEFVSGPAARQRYWARSHLGWSRMGRAEPNAGHRALAALGPGAADHPERRRPARGGRLPTPGRPARPDRRRHLPRLPGDVVARGAAGAAGVAEPGVRRAARRRRGPSRRRRRPRRHRRLRRAAVHRLRRRAQARRGVLRRERAPAAGRALLRRRRRSGGVGRDAAGRRLVADRDERLPLRPPRRQCRGPGGDRQPRPDPRRRPGDVQARGRGAASSWTRARPGPYVRAA